MFSIPKKMKIQVFHLASLDNKINTEDVDARRATEYVKEMTKNIGERIHRIMDASQIEDTITQIDRYFPKNSSKINEFFKSNLDVFGDLIRILHKRRQNDRSNGWYIPEKYHCEIQQIFLFRDHDGKKKFQDIPLYVDTIINNKSFIEFCSSQQSILDIGSYDFSLVKKNGRKKRIGSLIRTGLVNHLGKKIDKYDKDAIENKFFPSTFTRIIHYLKEIYNIDISELYGITTIDELAECIEEMFEEKNGTTRKKAWKIIQSFYAWGDVVDIEKRYRDTEKIIATAIPNKAKEYGIDIDYTPLPADHKGAKIYTGTWDYLFNGKKYTIGVVWRAKTPKSMLKKLWETEEYVRASSIRDEIGISFVFPDDVPDQVKVKIMTLGSRFMPNNGYILKDKGAFKGDNQNEVTPTYLELLEDLKGINHNPLFESSKPGGDPNFVNASMSGFTKLVGKKGTEKAYGCEIQFISQSCYDWKKKDDIRYKPKGAMELLIRGANQASPREVFDMLQKEVQRNDFPTIGISSYTNLIIKMIEEGTLKPYVAQVKGKGSMVLFTNKNNEDIFLKKWNKKEFTLCNGESHPEWKNIITYIEKLEGPTDNSFLAIV